MGLVGWYRVIYLTCELACLFYRIRREEGTGNREQRKTETILIAISDLFGESVVRRAVGAQKSAG